MDPGLVFAPSDMKYFESLSPANDYNSQQEELFDNLLENRDTACQGGSEVVLKRIVKKLFNQFDQLQPNELDDEFVYQSTLTYGDYINLAKFSQDELNCGNLNRIENTLSDFISDSSVKRPIHTNLFNNYQAFNLYNLMIPTTPEFQMLIIPLIFIALTGFLMNYVLRITKTSSTIMAIFMVSFVQFCMQKSKLAIYNRKCETASFYSKLLSFLGVKYDENCDIIREAPNIALMLVEFSGELIFQPLVQFGSKSGAALEAYMKSFSFLNSFLAPIYMVLLLLVAFFTAWTCTRMFPTRELRHLTCDNCSGSKSIKHKRKGSIQQGVKRVNLSPAKLRA